MEIEIIRSKRRKKTAQARVVDGTIRIYVPAGLGSEREQEWIDDLIKKVEKHARRRKLNSVGDLLKEA